MWWLTIAAVAGWVFAVAGCAWGANRHLKLRAVRVREEYRSRVAAEAIRRERELFDDEPAVILKFPVRPNTRRA